MVWLACDRQEDELGSVLQPYAGRIYLHRLPKLLPCTI